VLIARKLEGPTDVFLKAEPILLQVDVSLELFTKRKRPASGGALQRGALFVASEEVRHQRSPPAPDDDVFS